MYRYGRLGVYTHTRQRIYYTVYIIYYYARGGDETEIIHVRTLRPHDPRERTLCAGFL